MLKFKYGKLVRDNIVKNQEASGAKPKYRLLNTNEHAQELIMKIIEETEEIIGSEDLAAEIADVQQALDDLRELVGVTNADVADKQKQKLDKTGGFGKGIYIEYVELDESDKWVRYYRDNPERYPEIL